MGAAAAVPLTGSDRLFLGELGSARDHRLHIALAARMPGPAPDSWELRRRVAEAATRAPVLTYRLARKGWEPDPAFDPACHVVEYRVAPGRDVGAAVVDAVRENRLLPEHPLWSLMVVHGYAADEHILCYRVHHAFQDGVGAARIATRAVLLGRTVPAPDPNVAVRAPARARMRLLATAARLAAPSARLRPPPGRTGRSGARTFFLRLDLAAFREIAAATGASVPQVGLAMLAGALRAWNPAHWRKAGRRGTTVSFPLNLNGRLRDGGLGNGATTMPVDLPCAEPEARERLRGVMEQTSFERMAVYRRDRYPVKAPAVVFRLLRWLVPKAFPGRLTVSVIGVNLPLDGCFAVPPTYDTGGGAMSMVYSDTTMVVSCVLSAALAHGDRLPRLMEEALEELRREVAQ
ncbi:wax ester/triacylglycerol synthase domain-containing protein [Nonomuraea sp. NPDC052116]|uniref:wax ester/triacylglycerol synthase domain-containing protein n=1 Tax=Nonomuraea sp. NPDC052116 TaxID=3155665 RepID=UPI00343B6DF0